MVPFYGGPQRLRGKRIAVWGLAFKPGTDDLREAPSLALIRQLLGAGASVVAYDPVAAGKAAALLQHPEGLSFSLTAAAALQQADALAVVTEWDEFLKADPAEVASQLADSVVFDGRNAIDSRRWGRHGLRVLQIGRPGSPVEHATDSVWGLAPEAEGSAEA